MKKNRDSSPWTVSAFSKFSWLAGAMMIFSSPMAHAANPQVLCHLVPAAVENSTPVGHGIMARKMNLTIGLPLRNREALTNLLQELYDPASPHFRQFLSADEFAKNFGPTESDYQSVVGFARSHGLAVTATHPNRTLVSVRGTLADVERAFHVTINEYQHPTESRTFFAPETDPAIDLTTPVLGVSGLDDFVLPHPCMHTIPAANVKPNLTGSAPGGAYMGNDFRAAYVPRVTLNGSGQTVGLLEFDSGFLQGNILTYENLAGLPNVPVTTVLLDGYNGAPGGEANVEVSLDIEMAISMAPGLNGVIVYEGSATDDILNRMATDNIAKQLSASWTYSIDANTEQIFLQYAAQGQSFFNASGDTGAYAGTVPTPSDDPNITVVGGTTLTTTGPGGAWASETTWTPYSSGGISTVYPIPSWQQGISMATNLGSATMRNLPDVAMTADNVFVVYAGGSGPVGGTSCATPLWAGFTALMNQLALTNGEPLVGFINPAVYAIGKGSNFLGYPSLFHDIATGNNENASSPGKFSAYPGYDLCTGWGTPLGSNLISAIAVPEPLHISPAGGEIFSGPVGGPFLPVYQTYTLTNTGPASLSWVVVNTSAWFNVTPSDGLLARGGKAAMVTNAASAAAGNLPAGSYSTTLRFTNRTDNFVQTRQLTLAVVTPPAITSQPTNLALLDGMTANFSVGIATNALMNYQWLLNGRLMTDGGNFSGTTTSTLTISNVSLTNVASYSVFLSNAAGTLTSSNASLTIVSSAPVIVQQPSNQTVLPGAPATFSVGAVGNTPYTYQWMFNGTNLAASTTYSGVTSSSLTVNNCMTTNTGTYSVVVRNNLGSANSSGAVLSIIPVTIPGVVMSTPGSLSGTNGQIIYSPLVQGTDGNLYGTALEGGTDGDGAVFRLTTNGVFSPLFSFNYTDGAILYAGLSQGKDGFYYGDSFFGGADGDGVIFRFTGSGALTTLVSLNGENGELPVAGMTQASDGNFYGTMYEGGPYGYGTIYRMTPANGSVTTLVAFNYDNGSYPTSVLIQGADGNLYGTSETGGEYGLGTVFKMSLSGVFSNIYQFTGSNDGAVPVAGLCQAADGNLYGTTYEGGVNGAGTVFQITPSGEFITRYSFTGGNDGGSPWGGLMQANDGNIYGTTQEGGVYGDGTVFQMAPAGSLATIAQFDGYNGGNPSAALIQTRDGSLYGTTENGGFYGDGAVYKLGFSGPLQITGEPEDQSVYLGGNTAFSIAVSGAGPLHFQWQKDGVNLTNEPGIAGATNATLVLSNATSASAAYYSVTVSNNFGLVTSVPALLDVIFSPPAIVSQPASQTALVGSTVVFSVGAVGDQPLSFQWRKNGGNLIGATSNSLTLSNLSLTSAGTYSVAVSNSIYTVSSMPAALTVLPVVTPGVVSTNLYTFPGTAGGIAPYAGLVQGSDGNLYGTTENGGVDFDGALFEISLGGALTTLYSFTDGNDGANPYASLIQSTNGLFYGTASSGGSNFYGTIFQLGSGRTAVTQIYSFEDANDGGQPMDNLILGNDGNFYGTAIEGGSSGVGSVFKMSPKNVLTPLYGFTGGNDGGYPYAGVIQGKDGSLYGTTLEFGSNGFGTVFRLATNGALTALAEFDYANGGYPQGGLIQGVDGNLYGTTSEGGTNGYGTVFRLTTNGALTTLFSFDSTNGGSPDAALLQASDGNLYGTTANGGLGGQGTAFRITTNGAFKTLLWFDGFNGADPEGAIIQATNGSFYGTTAQGGVGFNPSSASGGNGTIFQFTVPLFPTNLIRTAAAVACVPYFAGISNFALLPLGDSAVFEKVSGPAWLVVSTSGALSGTPTNSNIGTNFFVVSLTDTNGFVATTTLQLTVVPDPAPFFVQNPVAAPWANVDEAYSASISASATDMEMTNSDVLSFGKVSGPAWLHIAPNGALSGTPEDINAGTNVFVVSATNLGGVSATATLIVYANSAPAFVPQNFATPAATVGLPYTASIAPVATDPDLIAGDILTFYVVSGPAWLNVAANGALSGTPSSENLGVNTFLVLAVDSGELSGLGNLSITVNAATPPAFLSSPFSEPRAAAGSNYSATIATNAADPNAGTTPIFSKFSGPAWLNVAANGLLSGAPASSDVGTNFFIVKITDSTTLSGFAVMSINVTAAQPLVLKISSQGSALVLSWTGGVPPYQIMTASQLHNSAWQNVGGPTTATNMTVMPSNEGAFYQVHGQ
jgi:uncharacterized repeat protein (TIGR03803 family)